MTARNLVLEFQTSRFPRSSETLEVTEDYIRGATEHTIIEIRFPEPGDDNYEALSKFPEDYRYCIEHDTQKTPLLWKCIDYFYCQPLTWDTLPLEEGVDRSRITCEVQKAYPGFRLYYDGKRISRGDLHEYIPDGSWDYALDAWRNFIVHGKGRKIDLMGDLRFFEGIRHYPKEGLYFVNLGS
jgi:hypothetical protein